MSAARSSERRSPAKGTKIRRLYDLFLLGHPLSTERIVLIFGKNAAAQTAIVRLRNEYGLDIRNVSRGAWRYFPGEAA